jgi:hypothetical protein
VRRRTAKYFDSYQWRKLLWFGLGMALYMLPAGHFISQPSGLAAFCIATGAFGTARWRIVSASSEYAKPSARKIK